MAAHHHPCRTHLFGEVGHGPHGGDFGFEAPRELVAIERPLIPMNHLRRLTGSDGNQLGQVDLEGAGVVAQHEVERVDDRRVGNE